MKNKLLLTIALISMLVFAFVIAANAETPSEYIEFGARFPGSDEYITVYTEHGGKASDGNPRIDFANKKFYSDVAFTQEYEVDMSTATGIDFSVAKTHGCNDKPVTRMEAPSSPFTQCVEVKWFLEGMPSVSYEKAFFKGWTGLKFFDFGNATAISDNAFEGCGLETITIPATITSIGGSAFYNCSSLVSVSFEGDIKKFNNGSTFKNCIALTSVNIDKLTSIGKNMFEKCTALTSITIPNGVTSIGTGAFYGCAALTSVTIPNGVTSIASSTFEKCTALTAVNVPNSVESIGSSAFKESAITSITIPSSVTTVGNDAFKQCGSLTTVTFEGDDTALGTSIFISCSKLESVTLPKNLVIIPKSTFYGCKKITITNLAELTQLTTIGASAFQDTSYLNFVLPDTVTTIEASAFQSAFKEGEGGSFVINKTSQLTTIGNSAFEDCRKMPASIYIPTTVTSIGTKAFMKCYTLQTLENFENCQITTIEDGTFSYASALKTLKIPETVTTIGKAFDDNNNLTLVYIPNSVTSVANTFTGGKPVNAVYVYTGTNASVFADCSKLANANKILGKDYNPDNTYTGINLVVGYSHCVAYNNGVHGGEQVKIVVTNYFEPLKKNGVCTLCDMALTGSEIPALFTSMGVSAKTFGDDIGLVQGYAINRAAIEAYKVYAPDFDFGILAYANKAGTSVTPKPGDDKVVDIVFDNMANDFIEVKITGIPSDYENTPIVFCIYAIDGEGFFYLDDGKTLTEIVGVSYSQLTTGK